MGPHADPPLDEEHPVSVTRSPLSHAAILSLLCAAGLGLGACRSGPQAQDDGAPAEVSTKKPMTKASDPADADRLGTLPEGVGIPRGSQAPDAEVLDLEGHPVRLSALYAEGPVMLVFYRGGWCPFCNQQLHELAEANAAFTQRGVRLVAVSVDRPDSAATTDATWEIPFPVLSDSKLAAHSAFAVLNHMDDKLVRRLGMFGFDVEAYSGETHHTVAVPSVFLIDGQGIVRWAHAETDYTVRPSVEQLLGVLDGGALTAP